MKKWQGFNQGMAVLLSFMLVFSFAGYFAVPAAADGLPSPSAIDLSPIHDAYVQGGGNTARNFGQSTSLQVKHESGNAGVTRESFLTFGLNGIPDIIGKAELHLYGNVSDQQNDGSDVYNHLYGVSSDWTEGTVTWNSKPDFGQQLDVIAANPQPQWHIVDVTAYVRQQILAGKPEASFGIRQEAGIGYLTRFYSKDGTENTPFLRITAGAESGQAPLWPAEAAITVSNRHETGVTLSWPSALDAGNDTVTYRVYQNADVVKELSQTVFAVSGLETGTTYTFKIEAGNSAGNWSQDGPSVTVELTAAPPSAIELLPVADTYVHGANAGINYGASNLLHVKNSLGNTGVIREAHLSFRLNEDIGEIGKAEFYIYGSVTEGTAPAADLDLYSVNTPWEENSVTWNTKPEFDDYLGMFHADRTGKWHVVDVTAYVKRQARDNAAVSIGLKQNMNPGYIASFNSREAAVNKPYLKITADRDNKLAPAWPEAAAITVVELDDTGATLSWPPAENNGAPVQYRVYQNGQQIAEAADNAISIDGLSTASKYTFKVEAGDGNNNWSQDGPFITVTTVETKLEQVKLGNIFVGDAGLAEFELVTNRSRVSWSVRNVWGAEVAQGEEQITGGRKRLAIPVAEWGHFTLSLQVESAGRTPIILEAPFAMLSPYDFRSVADSPFGINTHFERPTRGWTPDLIELIEYAGLKNVRGGIEWRTVEWVKDNYIIREFQDHYINEMAARNINILMLLAYNNPNYDGDATPYTDEGREGFADYAQFMLNYFGDKVDAYEIYNEFNIDFGRRGNGLANSQASYYYPLLATVYDRMKAINPDKTLVGMATSKVPFRWIEDVYKLGGMEKQDVVSVHPYQFPKSPEHMMPSLERLHELNKQYNGGEEKPVWLTEMGVPSHTGASGVDVKTQADYIVRTYVSALAAGVGKLYLYDFMNDGLNAANSEQNYGLVYHHDDPRGKHTPKPAYAAVAAMTRVLTGAEFRADESAGEHIRQYRFTKEGEDIRVVWSMGELQQAAIHSQAPVRIVDVMGNETIYYPEDGKVHYTLKDEPVYVLGDIEGIEADGSFVLNGEPSIVGDEGLLTMKVDYRGDAAFNGAVVVNGKSYPFEAQHGQPIELSISVPGLSSQGHILVIGQLVNDEGLPVGLLTAKVDFNHPYDIKVRPVWGDDGNEKQLHIIITNYSANESLTANAIGWSVGSLSGTAEAPRVIAPSSVWTEKIALEKVEDHTGYPMQIDVELQGFGEIGITSRANFTPVYHVNEQAGQNVIVWSNFDTGRLQDYTGDDDLSAAVQLSWDEDNLYMDAQVSDDIFYFTGTESDIWTNDSFQFAIAKGIPGESTEWYEYGISQTDKGPQVYRWVAAGGLLDGMVDSAELEVRRDEAAKITYYSLALPWTELVPVVPEDGVFSLSLLLNENDGYGRNGYAEWGSGIGGTKDPQLFRTVQLVGSGDGGQPEAPTAPELSAAAMGQTTVELRWTESTVKEGAVRYELYRNDQLVGGAEEAQFVDGLFRYTVTGLQAGTAYSFRVDAVSEAEVRTAGNTLTVKTSAAPWGGGGTVSPSLPAEEGVTKVTAAQLNAAAGETVVVAMEPGDHQLSLPLNAAELLGSGRLTVVQGDAEITFPSAVLQQLSEMEEASADSGLLLVIRLVEAEGAAKLALQPGPGQLLPAGAWLQLGLAAAGGETLFPDGLSRSVTISLPYDEPADVQLLGIYGYSNREGRWAYKSGRTAANQRRIATEIEELGLYAALAYDVQFADVPKGHWANRAIQRLAAMHIVEGTGGSLYVPERSVTRAEFAAMLARALELEADGTADFADIDPAQWYAKPIAAVQAAGIVNGRGDGQFVPNGIITREEMAVMLIRAYQYKEGIALPDESAVEFADKDHISGWAIQAVAAAQQLGLIAGYEDNSFGPDLPATRAHSAQVLIRLLDQVN